VTTTICKSVYDLRTRFGSLFTQVIEE
jgi:hypothetical protein